MRSAKSDNEGVFAVMAPSAGRDNPLTRSLAGMIGGGVLLILVLACVGSLPLTLGSAGRDVDGRPLPARYKQGDLDGFLLPPTWAGMDLEERERFRGVARNRAIRQLARETGAPVEGDDAPAPSDEQIEANLPFSLFGTDKLGRDLFTRCLAGGGVSIGIGIAAAAISVIIGTLYGTIAGTMGGRVDSVMMRIVDILYGLPYLLLVVLLAVAGDSLIDAYSTRLALDAQAERKAWMLSEVHEGAISREAPDAPGALADSIQGFMSLESPALQDARHVTQANRRAIRGGTLDDFSPIDRLIDVYLDHDADARTDLEMRATANTDLPRGELSAGARTLLEVLILLTAIGGLAWLTMARVIRGQVLSLKAQPFMEAARAVGVPMHHQFLRHLLPNLLGPIIVYTTLTVPQAILQESFLSFLGIGVRPPLPSWGNLAADGLIELNTVKIRWWLLLFPSLLLGITLLALNFVGEGLREAFDPKRARK